MRFVKLFRIKIISKSIFINGGRHDNKFKIMQYAHERFYNEEGEIQIHIPFMYLIKDKVIDIEEILRAMENVIQNNTICNEKDVCLLPRKFCLHAYMISYLIS